MHFDIPAQALADALQHYAMISNRPALFSSAQVAGRQASAVTGEYSPEEALQRLLRGSGLVARAASSGPVEAFVLTAEEADPATASQAAAQGHASDYGDQAQARIWAALCADARTTPGDYRSLLRIAIAPDGSLGRSRLLTSTGFARRDMAVLQVLTGLRLPPPPPQLEQPLTLLLLPRQPGEPSPCRERSGAS